MTPSVGIGNYGRENMSLARTSVPSTLCQGSGLAAIDLSGFEVLSFDCYGTLVDWETGIVSALRRFLLRYDVRLRDEQILELYAEFESKAEAGPFVQYRQVLREVVNRIGQSSGIRPVSRELDCLEHSLTCWNPFPGTLGALQALSGRYRLAIISNVDDDLLSITLSRFLGVRFDWIITSEQAKAYKPCPRVFELAIRRIGVDRRKILHVAQSIYHDINPAKTVGLSTLWINHAKLRDTFGATPPAYGQPDLEATDLTEFVALAGLNSE